MRATVVVSRLSTCLSILLSIVAAYATCACPEIRSSLGDQPAHAIRIAISTAVKVT